MRLLCLLLLLAAPLSAQSEFWSQSPPTWPARFSHTTASFNGRLWVLGGRDEWSQAYTNRFNDVWSSDNGIHWVQATGSAGWSPRHSHSTVVFSGKLWVLGGDDGGDQNDIWSSIDGVNWTLEVPSAPWEPRHGHSSAVFDNRLWVMGGNGSIYGTRNDVWSSPDGVNWTLHTTSAAWPVRKWHRTEILNNRLWLMGGYGGVYHDDIWSSADGVNWTQELGVAPWGNRSHYAAATFNNKLWIFGGYMGYPVAQPVNDVWSSPDGVNWVQEAAAASWAGRSSHQAQVHDNRLWILGGHLENKALRNESWWSADGISWSTGHWSPRNLHASVVFNNRIWVLGGLATGYPYVYYNDVWSSADGAHWRLETAAAPWEGRFFHAAAAFDNRLWVLGGTTHSQSSKNDVWSSVDGINWVQESAAAPWLRRNGHAAVEFANRLWVAGGYGALAYLSDCWSSADGVNWVQETSVAPWQGRGEHTCTVFNNRLWIMGGGAGATIKWNDVWSSADGANWIEETAPTTAPWPARMGHTAVAHGNRLWVLGGEASSYTFPENDVWSSPDGVNWTQEAATIPWQGRVSHTSVEFQNRIWVMGGFTAGHGYNHQANDVWSFGVAVQPQITSSPPTTAAVGMPFSHSVMATGFPSPSLAASGLPSWLRLNGDQLVGIPTPGDRGVTGTIQIVASNSAGTDTQGFQLSVAMPPAITSAPVTIATAGVQYSYAVAATGFPPPALSAGTLPVWLTFNSQTGELIGTPGAGDMGLSVPIDIIADNGWPPAAVQTFQINVQGQPPSFLSTPKTTAYAGVKYAYALTASGIPQPSFSVSGNPAWLTLTGNVLNGTPTKTDIGTTITVTVTATNGWAPDGLQSFDLVVAAPPPAPAGVPDERKPSAGCGHPSLSKGIEGVGVCLLVFAAAWIGRRVSRKLTNVSVRLGAPRGRLR